MQPCGGTKSGLGLKRGRQACNNKLTNISLVYLIKVKGVAKIPDYVQLRDDEFTLLAYFRVDRPDKALEKCGMKDQVSRIMKIVNSLPFGKIVKFDL